MAESKIVIQLEGTESPRRRGRTLEQIQAEKAEKDAKKKAAQAAAKKDRDEKQAAEKERRDKAAMSQFQMRLRFRSMEKAEREEDRQRRQQDAALSSQEEARDRLLRSLAGSVGLGGVFDAFKGVQAFAKAQEQVKTAFTPITALQGGGAPIGKAGAVASAFRSAMGLGKASGSAAAGLGQAGATVGAGMGGGAGGGGIGGGAAAAAAGGAGAAGMSSLIAAGAVAAAALAAAGAAAFAAAKGMQILLNYVSDGVDKLAEFNGNIAGARAGLQVNQTMRRIGQADELEDIAIRDLRSQNELDRELTRTQTEILKALAPIAVEIREELAQFLQFFNEIFKAFNSTQIMEGAMTIVDIAQLLKDYNPTNPWFAYNIAKGAYDAITKAKEDDAIDKNLEHINEELATFMGIDIGKYNVFNPLNDEFLGTLPIHVGED